MPKTFETLSLQDAKRMLAAGEARAEQIGIPYNFLICAARTFTSSTSDDSSLDAFRTNVSKPTIAAYAAGDSC